MDLQRRIGPFTATNVVVANMIGTGVFTTSGFIVQQVSGAWQLLLCWLLGGAFALCGALCYGELGARFPRAGGEYVFLRESFGPAMGFLSGWISLIVGFSAPIAAASIALAAYLLGAAGGSGAGAWRISSHGVTLLTISPRTGIALAAIWSLSVVHYLGVALGGRVQNLLTLLKLAVITAFVAGGLAWGQGSWSHLEPGVAGEALRAGPLALSLIFVSFAYSGWNAAAYIGGEITDPGRNIPRALIWGTLAVCAIYLAVNMIYLYALPPASMAGVLEVGAAAAAALFGPGMGRVLGLAIALGLLSVISSMVLTGPRVYYAMARDRVFFAALGRVAPGRRTPAAAIWLQAAVASAMVVTASFDMLLIYIGFTLSLFTMLAVAGLPLLRKKASGPGPAYRTWGYPVIPLLYVLGNLWIVAYTITSRPAACLAGLVTLAAGLVVYWCFKRLGGRME